MGTEGSDIVVWEKAASQPLMQIRSKINYTLQVLKDLVLILTICLSIGFLWQNYTVGYPNFMRRSGAESVGNADPKLHTPHFLS